MTAFRSVCCRVGRSACRRGQELEVVGEPGPQRADAEQLDPRGRELDRERQPVEEPADLGDVGGVVRVEPEVRAAPCWARCTNSCTAPERAQLLDASRAGGGQGQRRHRVLELAVEVQRTARGREDREPGAVSSSCTTVGGGGQLLEVVEDQQGAAASASWVTRAAALRSSPVTPSARRSPST